MSTDSATRSDSSRSVLYFLGDVYLPHPVELQGELPGALIYNQEAPLTRATRGWPATVNLRVEEDHAVATFGRHPAAVCLANNHVMDFGAEGLRETTERLEASGVAHFGAGTVDDGCGNPLMLPVGDALVALVGYVCRSSHPVFASAGSHPGVAAIEFERIAADVARARRLGATRVVVCLHWGIEEVELPRPEDVRLARAIAELGVDLVIGHHAHCIQPFEVHAGVPIFYGLGNAVFPDVDCWSEYDAAGNPGRRWRKRQNYWNRPSLGVSYDVRTGTVSVDRWHCDGRTLRLTHRDVRGPQLRETSAAEYVARFRKHHFRAVWRKKLVNLAREPRLPQPRHLRSLMRILQEARG